MINNYYIVIADVHGEVGALVLALKRVDAWFESKAGTLGYDVKKQMVFLGDYIDRGTSHSAVLLRVKHAVENEGAICLLGNHEGMLIGTAEDTTVEFDDGRRESNSDLWFINDGVKTCREMFGKLDPAGCPEGRDPLRYGYHVDDYVPVIKESWEYNFLKKHGRLSFETETIFFSHAPQSEKSITPDSLLWGRRRDYRDTRGDSIFKVPGNKNMAVHGHMHMAYHGISFPRIMNFEHGSKMRTVIMADCGCGSHSRGELHPVIIREHEVLRGNETVLQTDIAAIL